MKKPVLIALLLVANSFEPALAQENKSGRYAAMAPVEQYLIDDAQAEIALARTAAPASISRDAEVLVLGRRGYESKVKGKNGFVCFVERSWTANFDDWQFWNPKLRAPNCFNAPAVHSVLPAYLERTQWALAGASKEQIIEKTRAAFASGHFVEPEPGSFSFMLSKQGYVSDDAGGPWLPHVMFFVPHGQGATWGAGLDGSPILGADASAIEPTVLYVPVREWSDGSSALTASGHHH